MELQIAEQYGAETVDPELSEALYEVVSRFVRAVDRREYELLRTCYHEDAYDDHGPLRGTRDEFVEGAKASCESMPFMFHGLNGFRVLAHRGDLAATETYFAFRSVTFEGMPWEQIGRYVDIMERREGEWKILRRWTVAEFTTPGVPGFDGSIYPQPAQDRTDLSFKAVEQVLRGSVD